MPENEDDERNWKEFAEAFREANRKKDKTKPDDEVPPLTANQLAYLNALIGDDPVGKVLSGQHRDEAAAKRRQPRRAEELKAFGELVFEFFDQGYLTEEQMRAVVAAGEEGQVGHEGEILLGQRITAMREKLLELYPGAAEQLRHLGNAKDR